MTKNPDGQGTKTNHFKGPERARKKLKEKVSLWEKNVWEVKKKNGDGAAN